MATAFFVGLNLSLNRRHKKTGMKKRAGRITGSFDIKCYAPIVAAVL
jgi:hypothetical protein